MIRSEEPAPGRWKSAAKEAAQRTLAARLCDTIEALEVAREEYRRLRSSAEVDVRAVRKAAQRVHDLEQLRWVLAVELGQPANG